MTTIPPEVRACLTFSEGKDEEEKQTFSAGDRHENEISLTKKPSVLLSFPLIIEHFLFQPQPAQLSSALDLSTPVSAGKKTVSYGKEKE